jgi:hypothetical protein
MIVLAAKREEGNINHSKIFWPSLNIFTQFHGSRAFKVIER